MTWTLYPAIDVRDGRVVRLAQGDYARETRYADDPCDLAVAYESAGAAWLHLVDLDAARAGGYSLLPLVASLRQRTGLEIQTGGGIRSAADVLRLLEAGVSRVVVGTLAVREPDIVIGWLERVGPERLTVALDAREDAQGVWRLPVKGWTEDSAESLDTLLARYRDAGLRHVLCTDIARDGMLGGFNLALYARLRRAFPELQVQASGGAAGLDDIRQARIAGAAGAVLGRALLDGRFTLAEAMTC